MICWPNARSRMPPRASSGLAFARPKMWRCSGGAVEAEQQIGRAQVKEAQGMRLHDLGQVQQPAQLFGGRRNLHRHDLIPRLHRRDQMADRADAADARGDAGHLGVGPADAEALEAAKLGHVETSIAHLASVIQVDGDLGVTFDAGHGIDDDALRHGLTIPQGPNHTGRTYS